jgi:glycosyltransferase involved in cell wall biosynthesis
MEKNLVMLSWQSYESMPDFIAAADVCVLPRKYSYHTAITGNPNTLFQYMAMGKPIVGTNLPSINSFVDDSSAVLVEPDSVASMTEGLRKVLDNPELARRIGQNAYRLAVEKYNWGKEEVKLLELYSDLSLS